MTGEASRHPESELVKRFLSGGASREERGLAVRHLLRGCDQCRRETLRIWEELEAMTDKKKTNKDMMAWGLAPIIEDLERIKARLAELVETLPPLEVTPSEPEDVAVRDLLGCTLTDRLEPALRELRALTGDAE